MEPQICPKAPSIKRLAAKRFAANSEARPLSVAGMRTGLRADLFLAVHLLKDAV